MSFGVCPADLLILDWERKRNTRPLQMLLGRELCARGAGFVVAPPAENTAEKQRVRQQMLARNWHDHAISSELGSFCQKISFELQG